MNAQDILSSPPFIMFGILIARTMPERFGYWLARTMAHRMAQRGDFIFSTLKENLAHVMGPSASADELDELAETAIYHAGCTYFDLFRRSVKDYRRGRVPLRVDPDQWAQLKELLQDERGTILVGPHTSNFDLAAQWLAAQDIEMQALSLTEPSAGNRVLNELRRRHGIIMTPIDVRSLRQAIRRLKGGGVVITGIDRPVSDNDKPIQFFDAPARMPTGHIRLALRTNSRIVALCCLQDPDGALDGAYAIRFSPPMDMETTGRRSKDIQHNTRRVLAIIEDMIREAPQQWLMFVPVWRQEDELEAGEGVPRIPQIP
jgi:KDO2-lipid IV(A) lauroyltransferase